MTLLLGFLTPFFVYAGITLLHFFLPGRWIVGLSITQRLERNCATG